MPGPFHRKRSRVLSALLLPVFCLAQIGAGFAQFAETSLSASAPISLQAAAVSIPPELGEIQAVHTGKPGRPLIIHIQDAHAVPDAQRSIQALIQFLEEHYGIRNVALEGGKGKLDAAVLNSFPDTRVKAQVLNAYVERGELTGGELAAIFDTAGADYVGIENWGLYQKNYRDYLHAVQAEPEILPKIGELQNNFAAEGRRIFSTGLRNFTAAMDDFFDGQRELTGLLEFLKTHPAIEKSRKAGLFQKTYPRLEAVLGALSRQGVPEDVRIRAEVEAVAQKLLKDGLASLAKNEQREFNQKQQAYRTGELEPGAFLAALSEWSARRGKTLPLADELKKLMQEHRVLTAVKGSEIYAELEKLAAQIETELVRSPEEQALRAKQHKLRWLKSLVKLELSLADYRNFLAASAECLALLPFELRPRTSAALSFYQDALLRDAAMEKNLDKLVSSHSQQSAILVTGGFHREGLQESFQRKDYSYVVILPAMKTVSGRETYRKVMAADVSYRNNLRSGLYDALMRHAGVNLARALDRANFRTVIKTWRDALIRKLAACKKLGHSAEYTRYIDVLWRVYEEKGADAPQAGSERTAAGMLKAIERELDHFRHDNARNFQAPFSQKVLAVPSELGISLAPLTPGLGYDGSLAELLAEAGRARSEMRRERSPGTSVNSAELRSEMRREPESSGVVSQVELSEDGKVLRVLYAGEQHPREFAFMDHFESSFSVDLFASDPEHVLVLKSIPPVIEKHGSKSLKIKAQEVLYNEGLATQFLNRKDFEGVSTLLWQGPLDGRGPALLLESGNGADLNIAGPYMNSRMRLGVLKKYAEQVRLAFETGVAIHDLKPDNALLIPTPAGLHRVQLIDLGGASILSHPNPKADHLSTSPFGLPPSSRQELNSVWHEQRGPMDWKNAMGFLSLSDLIMNFYIFGIQDPQLRGEDSSFLQEFPEEARPRARFLMSAMSELEDARTYFGFDERIRHLRETHAQFDAQKELKLFEEILRELRDLLPGEDAWISPASAELSRIQRFIALFLIRPLIASAKFFNGLLLRSQMSAAYKIPWELFIFHGFLRLVSRIFFAAAILLRHWTAVPAALFPQDMSFNWFADTVWLYSKLHLPFPEMEFANAGNRVVRDQAVEYLQSLFNRPEFYSHTEAVQALETVERLYRQLDRKPPKRVQEYLDHLPGFKSRFGRKPVSRSENRRPQFMQQLQEMVLDPLMEHKQIEVLYSAPDDAGDQPGKIIIERPKHGRQPKQDDLAFEVTREEAADFFMHLRLLTKEYDRPGHFPPYGDSLGGKSRYGYLLYRDTQKQRVVDMVKGQSDVPPEALVEDLELEHPRYAVLDVEERPSRDYLTGWFKIKWRNVSDQEYKKLLPEFLQEKDLMSQLQLESLVASLVQLEVIELPSLNVFNPFESESQIRDVLKEGGSFTKSVSANADEFFSDYLTGLTERVLRELENSGAHIRIDAGTEEDRASRLIQNMARFFEFVLDRTAFDLDLLAGKFAVMLHGLEVRKRRADAILHKLHAEGGKIQDLKILEDLGAVDYYHKYFEGSDAYRLLTVLTDENAFRTALGTAEVSGRAGAWFERHHYLSRMAQGLIGRRSEMRTAESVKTIGLKQILEQAVLENLRGLPDARSILNTVLTDPAFSAEALSERLGSARGNVDVFALLDRVQSAALRYYMTGSAGEDTEVLDDLGIRAENLPILKFLLDPARADLLAAAIKRNFPGWAEPPESNGLVLDGELIDAGTPAFLRQFKEPAAVVYTVGSEKGLPKLPVEVRRIGVRPGSSLSSIIPGMQNPFFVLTAGRDFKRTSAVATVQGFRVSQGLYLQSGLNAPQFLSAVLLAREIDEIQRRIQAEALRRGVDDVLPEFSAAIFKTVMGYLDKLAQDADVRHAFQSAA